MTAQFLAGVAGIAGALVLVIGALRRRDLGTAGVLRLALVWLAIFLLAAMAATIELNHSHFT